jgi:hypothetical protein
MAAPTIRISPLRQRMIDDMRGFQQNRPKPPSKVLATGRASADIQPGLAMTERRSYQALSRLGANHTLLQHITGRGQPRA